MATMTATFIKPSCSELPAGKALYHHPALTASKSASLASASSSSSNSSAASRFPYPLAYGGGSKSAEVASLYGDHSSAAAAAFLALHHHHHANNSAILRSSSLYDNSNYARTSAGGSVSPFSSAAKGTSFAHPDFDASMLQLQQGKPIKSTVISIPSAGGAQQLPRVEVAKVGVSTKPKSTSISSSSSSTSSEDGENNYLHHQYTSHRTGSSISNLVERLSAEEHQALSRLLYKHFANSGNGNGNNRSSSQPSPLRGEPAAPVPADYDQEDPRTWPSNWLAQVPTMILAPEAYLASKPLLNAYQRQLIRRLAAKYEPLVVHYLQQLVALRGTSSGEVRKFASGRDASEYSGLGASSLQHSNSSSRSHLGAKKSLVKSASHASALSSSSQAASANNSNPASQHHQTNNSFDLGGGNFCHKSEGAEGGGNIGSSSRRSTSSNSGGDLRPSHSLDSSSTTTTNSSSNSSSLMSSSRSNSSLSTSASSPSQPPSQAPTKSGEGGGGSRENNGRLARLSQQMANKWSNKMKVYLRKN